MASGYPAQQARSKRVPPAPLKDCASAVTEDGRVLCMTPTKKTTAPVHFDYEKQLSPSHAAKGLAKDDYRMLAAARLGHKLCEAEECKRETTCSIDQTGVVHNAAALKPTTPSYDAAQRAKKFHQKRENRRKASEVKSPPLSPVLSADLQGHIELPDDFDFNLDLPLSQAMSRQCSIDSDGVLHDGTMVVPPSPQDKNNRLKNFHRKLAARKGEHPELENNTIVYVDTSGCVHDKKPIDRTPLIVPMVVSAY